MIYTTKESLEQVLERSEQVRRKRERRRLTAFSLSVCAMLLTLVLGSVKLVLPAGGGASSMGSFLLRAETGGIVAAIVLAFALGVLATLFCIRKKRTDAEQSPSNSQHEEDGGTKL